MNLAKDNEVTAEDAILAENACGQDAGALKEKSARARPQPAIDNCMEIPEELIALNHEVTISTDRMFVNSLQFLTSIGHDLFCRTAQGFPNRPT